jgi:hypothetical protein
MRTAIILLCILCIAHVAHGEKFILNEIGLEVISPDENWTGGPDGSLELSQGFTFSLWREGKSKRFGIYVRRVEAASGGEVQLTALEEFDLQRDGSTIVSKVKADLAGVECFRLRVQAKAGSGDSKAVIYVFQIRRLRYHIVAVMDGPGGWPDEDREIRRILHSVQTLRNADPGQPTAGADAPHRG